MSASTLRGCAHCSNQFHAFPRTQIYCCEDCRGRAKRLRFHAEHAAYIKAWRARKVNRTELDAAPITSA